MKFYIKSAVQIYLQGDLQALVKLDLSTNQLRSLPPSMGRLRKIQRLDCSNNMIAKVPSSIGHLKSLKEFNLRYLPTILFIYRLLAEYLILSCKIDAYLQCNGTSTT